MFSSVISTPREIFYHFQYNTRGIYPKFHCYPRYYIYKLNDIQFVYRDISNSEFLSHSICAISLTDLLYVRHIHVIRVQTCRMLYINFCTWKFRGKIIHCFCRFAGNLKILTTREKCFAPFLSTINRWSYILKFLFSNRSHS